MKSIAAIAGSVLSGSVTAESLVEEALDKATAAEEYHALLAVTRDRALQRARAIDQKVASGEHLGVLAGVPFVVKDNYLAFGAPSTAAARIMENFDAPLQATVVEKLEAAGAICIGKANLDAFAHGSTTENSAFGPTKNAIDKSRVPGGSSGGSAVVTALDIVPFALGTDTGGSIRQPAAFNGVVGVKPTYGMNSRYGVVAMASSTDVMGCFTRSADDAALVLSVMAGRDPNDMTTLDDFFVPTTLDKTLRVGVVTETIGDGVEDSIKQAVAGITDRLKQDGHTVEEVRMPIITSALAMYYVIVPAEVSSNLARYDGVRYGRRAAGARTLAELYGRSRDEGFMTENKRRIMIGSYVLSSGYFDAYYLQAQKARTLLINEFDALFRTFDILISPTTPTTAFRFGEHTDDPVSMYMSDVMTVPANLAGIPAISIPWGSDDNGLPIGMQLMANMKQDALLLALAASLEEKK